MVEKSRADLMREKQELQAKKDAEAKEKRQKQREQREKERKEKALSDGSGSKLPAMPALTGDQIVISDFERKILRTGWIILYWSNYGRLTSSSSTGILGHMNNLKEFFENKILNEKDINYKVEYNKIKKRSK